MPVFPGGETPLASNEDRSIGIDVLADKWVDPATTLYIGRACNLGSRLKLLARFGKGEPVSHWGGRYLWQLRGHDQLLVAWREELDPVRAESELLDEVESAFGRLPFANLIRGARRTPVGV